jgi:hypothetical protein
VKTAKDTVPMMNASELLTLSINGGLDPCCVNDDNHEAFDMLFCVANSGGTADLICTPGS